MEDSAWNPPPTGAQQLQSHRDAKTKKLCKWCQRLSSSFEEVFRKQYSTAIGRALKTGGPARGPKVDSCRLCELFAKTFGTLKIYRSSEYRPRAFSSNRINDRGWDSVSTAMLSFEGDTRGPFLVPQTEGANTVRILSSLVSLDLLKDWMGYCRRRHTNRCGRAVESSMLRSIFGFKVIDCETGRIVPWSGQRYATLSYVPGKNSRHPSFACVLPDEIPSTIEDAIRVTLSLEIKYLWVDKYCINQDDEEQIVDQIPKMDLIYGSSEVTIIAAAGKDENYGLPGVGPLRHIHQPRARIGKHHLVSSMADPTRAIARSAWWKKASAYQEGILARRRIVFTNEQAYFECGGMYCCEALNLNLDALHTDDGQRFRARYCDGISKENVGLFPAELGYSPWEMVERITEYSHRTVDRESEVLAGVLGLLRALGTSREQLRHILGVPVLPLALKAKHSAALSRYLRKSTAPKSTLLVGFVAGLCWEGDQRMKRRPGFPSWSWIGWKCDVTAKHTAAVSGTEGWNCPVSWPIHHKAWWVPQGETDLQIRVGLQGNRVISWDEFEANYSALGAEASGVLELHARGSPVFIRRRRGGWCDAQMVGKDGQFLLWKFPLDGDLDVKVDSSTFCLAIPLAEDISSDLFSNHKVLVVARQSPGVWERIGLGRWSDLKSCIPSENSGPRSGCSPSLLATHQWDFRLC